MVADYAPLGVPAADDVGSLYCGLIDAPGGDGAEKLYGAIVRFTLSSNSPGLG